MKTRLCITAAVLGLAIWAATAGASPLSYSSCLKKAATTAAMQHCVSVEWARVQAQLASAYAKLSTKSGVNKTLLAAAQSRWLAFRTADCKFAGSFNAGGSLATINQGDCLITDTAARVTAP